MEPMEGNSGYLPKRNHLTLSTLLAPSSGLTAHGSETLLCPAPVFTLDNTPFSSYSGHASLLPESRLY